MLDILHIVADRPYFLHPLVISSFVVTNLLNIGETAVDSLCGKLATYVTSTTPR